MKFSWNFHDIFSGSEAETGLCLTAADTRKGGNRERRERESEGWTGGTRKEYRTLTSAF